MSLFQRIKNRIRGTAPRREPSAAQVEARIVRNEASRVVQSAEAQDWRNMRPQDMFNPRRGTAR